MALTGSPLLLFSAASSSVQTAEVAFSNSQAFRLRFLKSFTRCSTVAVASPYFGAASGVLVVKMTKLWHEVVKTKAINVAERQIPTKDVLRVGSTRYESHYGNLGAKEADDGIMPKHRLLGGYGVPSFVLEVANTQSLADARKAIQWWFQNLSPNNAQHGVQYGLIVKISNAKLGNITFKL